MCFSEFWNWFTSKGELSRVEKTSAEKLHLSIRVTAKCRFNASKRLNAQGKFNFFATTILSLGLILIPLLQNTGISLAFDAKVLNMMSIFLAVAVLVYSIIIGTAKYEIRAEKLNQCGNQLKALTRELDSLISNIKTNNLLTIDDDLKKLNKKFFNIITDTENHEDYDYLAAILEMPRDYKITGISRLKKYLKIKVYNFFPYILPIILLLLEIVFITDMLKITNILTSYLQV